MRLQRGVSPHWPVVAQRAGAVQLLVGAVRLLGVVVALVVDPGSRLHRVAGSEAEVVLAAKQPHHLRSAAVVPPIIRPDRQSRGPDLLSHPRLVGVAASRSST